MNIPNPDSGSRDEYLEFSVDHLLDAATFKHMSLTHTPSPKPIYPC
jgi:hypothetical protein